MAKATAELNQYYGTGRRKRSVARVYLRPGTGNIIINQRPIDEYFGRDVLKTICRQPLKMTGTEGKFDVKVNVKEAERLDKQGYPSWYSPCSFGVRCRAAIRP